MKLYMYLVQEHKRNTTKQGTSPDVRNNLVLKDEALRLEGSLQSGIRHIADKNSR